MNAGYSSLRRPWSWIALAALALAPLACGGNSAGVYPARGEVFVQGQPAVGATVTFYPIAASNTPSASGQVDSPGGAKPQIATGVVEKDGSFRLTTFRAYDGAAPGDYAVGVAWSDSVRDDGDAVTGPDKLNGQYADPKRSGLKATITAGTNKAPRFNLTVDPNAAASYANDGGRNRERR